MTKTVDLKTKNEFSKWKLIREGTPFYVMLAPFLLLFTVLIIIPVVAAIVLSFTDFNMLQFPNFVGIDNYVRLLLKDDIFTKALKNTLVFAVVSGPVGYLMSFVVAWFINELGKGTKNLITLIMYAPTLAGNIYYIWTFIFASDSKGLINSLLIQLGIITDPIAWLTNTSYNFTVVMIVIIWASMGTGFLALVAGFKSLDRAYFEAAAIDGIRNRWQELYFVTLPQMGPQLLFSAVQSISGAFAIGAQCAALTGNPSTNYSTHTILLHMTDYGTVRFEMGYASTIAVILFAIMLLSWVLINKVLQKFTSD